MTSTTSFTRASARRRGALAATVAALLALVIATASAQAPAPTPEALDGVDAYGAVELANAWKGSDVTSFATSRAVHFAFPDGTEVAVPMPADEMLVSVAPYVRQTHPCTTHYMSGCQGELVDVAMQVRATLTDGTVVLDDTVRTGGNGFMDLWLPREEGIMLSFAVEGYAAEGFLTTFADSATCITTVQLAASTR